MDSPGMFKCSDFHESNGQFDYVIVKEVESESSSLIFLGNLVLLNGEKEREKGGERREKVARDSD